MDLLPAVHVASLGFAVAVTQDTTSLCQAITKVQGLPSGYGLS